MYSARAPRTSRHFYPRPPRGGRLVGNIKEPENSEISIHALREEGDLERVTLQLISAIFLSTPSARRATPTRDTGTAVLFISIHALREEGDR